MKKFLRSSIYNGFSAIYSMIFVVAWYYLVVKLYDDSLSANLLLWLSLASITSLADLGVSTAITGLLPKLDEKERSDFVLSVLPFYGLYLILIALTSYIIVNYFELIKPLGEYFFAPLILYSFSLQFYLFGISILKGFLSFRAVSVFNIINTTSTYGFSILAFYYYQNIYSSFIVLSIFSFLIVICLYLYIVNNGKPSFKFNSLGFSKFCMLLSKGILYFPQIFIGFFFTHVIRFVTAFFLGSNSVTIVSFSFSVASRIHALFNSFIELLFPLFSGRKITVNMYLVQKGLWIFFILIYLPSICILAYFLNTKINGIMFSTVYFCLGTWLSIQLAPYFHYFNAQDDSILISRISIYTLLLYLIIIGITLLFFQIDKESFSKTYLITNVLIYAGFTIYIKVNNLQTNVTLKKNN